MAPHVLLVNPWITDFAAYNLWIKPFGLLKIASLLRRSGFEITLIDCLDGYTSVKRCGDGKFTKTKIEKPEAFKSALRHYSRYGITEEAFRRKLSSIPKPDIIGVTSGMTYWYPGLFKVIEITRSFFKSVPIILGGIYASLCYEHAKRYTGADYIIPGEGESEVLKVVSELTHSDIPQSAIRNPHSKISPNSELQSKSHPYPAFDLYPHLEYVCMATSKGCPLRCTYCASGFLNRGFVRRDPDEVVKEIEYWANQHQIRNIAFYDDALLIGPSGHFVQIFEEIIRRRIRCNFHAPNGLHIREVDEEVAALLFRAGFKTIRLGFETSDEANQLETGGKVGNAEFRRAVENLKRAGFSEREIGVYVMVGLPGQAVKEVEESIAFVREAGARPMIVEYSPIPHTALFEKAKAASMFDLENEPLFHNNSILPCQWEGFTWENYLQLKANLRERYTDETI